MVAVTVQQKCCRHPTRPATGNRDVQRRKCFVENLAMFNLSKSGPRRIDMSQVGSAIKIVDRRQQGRRAVFTPNLPCFVIATKAADEFQTAGTGYKVSTMAVGVMDSDDGRIG